MRSVSLRQWMIISVIIIFMEEMQRCSISNEIVKLGEFSGGRNFTVPVAMKCDKINSLTNVPVKLLQLNVTGYTKTKMESSFSFS